MIFWMMMISCKSRRLAAKHKLRAAGFELVTRFVRYDHCDAVGDRTGEAGLKRKQVGDGQLQQERDAASCSSCRCGAPGLMMVRKTEPAKSAIRVGVGLRRRRCRQQPNHRRRCGARLLQLLLLLLLLRAQHLHGRRGSASATAGLPDCAICRLLGYFLKLIITMRRVTIIAGDSRETTYLFQQLSAALQKGNAVSFQNTFTAG